MLCFLSQATEGSQVEETDAEVRASRKLLTTSSLPGEPALRFHASDASLQFGVGVPQPAYLSRSGDGTISVNHTLKVTEKLQVGASTIEWSVVEQLATTVAAQASIISQLQTSINTLQARAGLPVAAPGVANFTVAEGSIVSPGQFVSLSQDLNTSKIVGGLPIRVFTPSNVKEVSVAHVNNTHFVVAYVDETDGNKGKLWFGDSATGSQLRDSIIFNSGETASIVVKAAGANIVVAYANVSQQSQGTLWIADLAGAKVAGTIFESAGRVDSVSLDMLSTTNFVVAYKSIDTSGANKGKFWIGLGPIVSYFYIICHTH